MKITPDIDEKEARQLLEEMIGINSVNPDLAPGGEGEKALAEYMKEKFESIGIAAEVVSLGGSRANVVARLLGKQEGKTLMLNGHLDTVGLEGMEGDPLKAKMEGDRVYGRGAGDMKAGLAAIFLAMKALKEQNLPPQGKVLFTGVADEEYKSIGTEDAARKYEADGCIITEPSHGDIVVAHKGFIWMEIDIYGKAAHGSNPQEGIDAIVKAGKFLTAMEDYGKNTLTQRSHPLLGSPSIHASLIKGGRELSTYPDHCCVSLEIRTLPQEEPEKYQQEIQDLIGRIQKEDPDFKGRAAITFSRPPMEVDPSEPIVQSMIAGAREAGQKEPSQVGKSGWLDSAILQVAGIPTVIYGPAGAGYHGAVEYTELSSIVEVAKGLYVAAHDFLGGGSKR